MDLQETCEGFLKLRVLCGVACDKDYSIVGPILGSRYLLKLPCGPVMTCEDNFQPMGRIGPFWRLIGLAGRRIIW